MTDHSPRFCNQCRFSAGSYRGDTSAFRCFSPLNPTYLDLVNGERKHYFTCKTAREEKTACGPLALWFEEKPPLEPIEIKGPKTADDLLSELGNI